MAKTSPSPQGALNGVRVLDFSRVLAGPWCTMTLADLGAEVIKVESLKGDDTRTWGPPFKHEMSAYFSCMNRNKKSLAVDLKSKEGQKIVETLMEQADVIVENFRTGVAEELGIGYEKAKKLNPKVVYCSISGYGRTGKRKDEPGYDFIAQAEGGIMSVTGEAGGRPHKVGVAIVDITTGQNASTAILAALIARGNTGEGQYIDISLYDTQIQWLANVASNALFSGDDAERFGNAHPNIVPYQAFEASDQWFALAIGNDSQWKRFCEIIRRPQWQEDNMFATNPERVRNRRSLIPVLEDIFRHCTAEEWIESFRKKQIPCSLVQTVSQALDSPTTKERGMRINLPLPEGGKIPMLGSPLNLSETPVAYHSPPPLIGEHSREVLTSIGYKQKEIEKFLDGSVIGIHKEEQQKATTKKSA